MHPLVLGCRISVARRQGDTLAHHAVGDSRLWAAPVDTGGRCTFLIHTIPSGTSAWNQKLYCSAVHEACTLPWNIVEGGPQFDKWISAQNTNLENKRKPFFCNFVLSYFDYAPTESRWKICAHISRSILKFCVNSLLTKACSIVSSFVST